MPKPKRKPSKKIFAVILLVVCVAVIFGLKLWRQQSLKSHEFRTGALAKVKGPEDAPIRLIEFFDFQCPSCAKGAVYLKEFIKKYPEKIRLEARYYPLANHQHGFTSALYAECAARQGLFWPFYDYLFNTQMQWSSLHDARPFFERIAKGLDLDMKKFDACLENKEVKQLIERSKEEGKMLGIESTPSFFINEKLFVGTHQLEEELNKLLGETHN